MERDDEQQHRHAARVTAQGLSILYEELVRRLPASLAEALVVEHYKWILQPDPGAFLSEMIDKMKGDADDGEGA